MEEDKPYLSISAIDLLFSCGEAYDRRYNRKERLPGGPATVSGGAVHAAAAANLTKKAEDGSLLSLEEVTEIARDSFMELWNAGVDLSAEADGEGAEAKIRGRSLDTAVQLAEFHAQALAPLINPVPGRIEWQFRIKTDLSHDLFGIVDVIEEREGKRYIRDLKTSKRMPSENKAIFSPQLTMYAMASKYIDHVEAEAVALDFLIPRAKGSEMRQFFASRDQQDEDVLMARVNRATQIIKSGAFTPARQGEDWKCSEKYCGYAKTCPFYNKKAVQG